jgi:flagellar biosynthesis activator protein FlaF
MYQALYSEMAAETTQSIRENERLAFERSVELLLLAQAKGRGSIESVKALLFASQLWGILMEDLAHPDNALPDALKASIISIGIWMLRRAEDIRQGRSADFASMIEVSKMIGSGLKRS